MFFHDPIIFYLFIKNMKHEKNQKKKILFLFCTDLVLLNIVIYRNLNIDRIFYVLFIHLTALKKSSLNAA